MVPPNKNAAQALPDTGTASPPGFRLDEVAEALDDVVWIYDPAAARMVYCSPAYERLWGLPVAGLLRDAAAWLQPIHPGDRDRALADSRELTRLGRLEGEYRLVTGTGAVRWIRSRGQVRHLGRPSRPYLVGVSEDITDYKQAVQALEEREIQLAAALQAARMAAWRLDLEHGIMQFVPSSPPLPGFAPPSDMPGFDPLLAIPPEEREHYRAEWQSLLTDPKPFDAELRILAPSGEPRWIHVRGGVARGPGRPVAVLGVSMDVTEKREQEEALRRAVAQRDLLLREVNHRIKNSLQFIANFLLVQAARMPPGEPRRLFEEAVGRVHAVGKVHERLYQTADADTVELNDYVGRLSTEMHQAGILCGADAAPACILRAGPVSVPTDDAICVGLILCELLANAAKHGQPPVEIRLSRDGSEVALSVGDAGSGLAGPASEHGIGLIIVRTMAAQLGGRFDIEGPPGTRMTVRFPVQVTTESGPRR
jgi:PAS domain S-box-containing protein